MAQRNFNDGAKRRTFNRIPLPERCGISRSPSFKARIRENVCAA